MAGQLADKIALVFGAGSSGAGWGNGKATAVTFAREGATVVAVDSNVIAAEETAGLIVEEGGKSVAMAADISKDDDVQRVVSEVMRRFGRIDVLQNNVGIMPSAGGLEQTTEDVWDHTMAVNVKGMFLTCRRVAPLMAKTGGGSIINISAIASIRWLGHGSISYSVSKGAVNSLTQAIALEYAPQGVRCNAILPGFMDTPMVMETYNKLANFEERMQARRAALPMQKGGTAWDVASASVYLASGGSAYVTGVLLPVDGGVIRKVK